MPSVCCQPPPSCEGTPDKPTLSQAAGSNAATASISVSKVFTATNYTVTLVDVRSPTNTASEVLSPAASEDGPWTSTLTAPAKGTYRFEVCVALAWGSSWFKASRLDVATSAMHVCVPAMLELTSTNYCCNQVTATNEHKAASNKAVSEAVVVGLPDAPTLPADAVTADVGRITLKWSAEQTNAFIDTKWVVVWVVVGHRAFSCPRFTCCAAWQHPLPPCADPDLPSEGRMLCLFDTTPPHLPPRVLHRYTAVLYRPQNMTAPYLSLPLKAAGTSPFTEELALPAGPYRLGIATSNVHGDGGKAGPTAIFTVGE